MLPPRHVYSAIVKNESGKDITVKAVYEVPTGEENNTAPQEVEITIAAGAQAKFDEKIVEAGTCTLIGNIVSIEVAGGVKATGPFVDSPARDVVFAVNAELAVAKQ